jgi:hypothetical protein
MAAQFLPLLGIDISLGWQSSGGITTTLCDSSDTNYYLNFLNMFKCAYFETFVSKEF